MREDTAHGRDLCQNKFCVSDYLVHWGGGCSVAGMELCFLPFVATMLVVRLMVLVRRISSAGLFECIFLKVAERFEVAQLLP